MSKPAFDPLTVASVTVAMSLAGASLFAGDVAPPARVLKHTADDGRIASMVILKAGEVPAGIVAHDHVILIDASASQVGEHRKQAFSVLDALLKELPAGDRVRLFAADLRAEPLSDGFVDARSETVRDCREQLELRVPLGATNLEQVLRAGLEAVADRPADITYIGDGMSTADLIEVGELRKLVADLRQRRVPVHSFGVGPRVNPQLLGILAHQTGGFVTLDSQVGVVAGPVEKTKSAKLRQAIAKVPRSAAESAERQGRILAAAQQAPVFFPARIEINSAEGSRPTRGSGDPAEPPTVGATMLPGDPLPIRTDRETIYLVAGVLPAETRIVLSGAGAKESLTFPLAAPIENPGAACLHVMVQFVETSGGLTNPLAGMTLFHLAQVDFMERAAAIAPEAEAPKSPAQK